MRGESRAASASCSSPPGSTSARRLIPYDALDTNWKAFLVGVLNTLRVAVVGVVLATLLGTMLGIGRFSRNAIVRGLCYGYVELFRNIPVLLQLLVWYLFFTDILPPISEPLSIGNAVFLSKAGFSFPVPVWGLGQALAAAGAAACVPIAWAYRRWAIRQFELTARVRSTFWVPLAIVIAGSFAGWIAGGAPTAWNYPAPGAFSMEGGASATPEFMARAAGPGPLHLGLHRGSGARRHRLGGARAGGGRGQPRPFARAARCAW